MSGAARLRAAGRILAVAAVVLGAALIWRDRALLDPETVSRAIAAEPAAPLVFLAVHVMASLLFLPRTVLAVAAGMLFGAAWGVVWAAAGSVLGAVAGFLVARHVNAGMIEPESLPRFGPVLQRVEDGGWRSVMALRLIPVIPHSLANYALGLTKLPLGGYALGSLLGQLPITIAYVDLGAAGGRLWAGQAGWLAPTLIGAAALLASFLLPRFARSRL
ncbi:MAG TPA: VTT domain-containing protein [Stellaceae bacterium]|nr:VTT domain-containing protein [Stellaceae bacterium]